MIELLGKRVALSVIKKDKSTGGIILPDTHGDTIITAKVAFCGPESKVKQGDEVIAEVGYRNPVKLGGQDLILVTDDEVVGILK